MMSKEVQGWWWKKNPRGEDDETRLDLMYMAEKKKVKNKAITEGSSAVTTKKH